MQPVAGEANNVFSFLLLILKQPQQKLFKAFNLCCFIIMFFFLMEAQTEVIL